MDLKDQIVVVTGGSEGLGKAIAEKLVHENSKIILLARSEDKLKAAKEDLLSLGGECEYFVCDVSNYKQVEKTFKLITEKFGAIDVLINNAGIWFEGKLEEHAPEKVKELFMINSVGPINTTLAVLPKMKEKKSGQILNVSSVAGVVAEPGWPVYVGTKYALRGFIDSLEAELAGTGVRVMGFYPGGMNTDLFVKAGFSHKNEPWMMDIVKVAEIVLFMLKQPKDITIDHVVVKSQSDYLLFEEDNDKAEA